MLEVDHAAGPAYGHAASLAAEHISAAAWEVPNGVGLNWLCPPVVKGGAPAWGKNCSRPETKVYQGSSAPA